MGAIMGYSQAFDVSRQIGTNFYNEGLIREQKQKQANDQNAIETILEQASKSGDPQILQDSIGKILSKVSPGRQGAAIKYLEGTYERIQDKQKQAKTEGEGRLAAKQAGYTYGVPPQVAAQQIKDKSKSGRLSQYGLNQQGEQQLGQQPSLVGNPSIPSTGQTVQSTPTGKLPQTIFEKMTKPQLVVASGAPDREISEPAKAQLKLLADEEDLTQKKQDANRKYHTEISQDILKENEKEARNIAESESSLGLMENAITEKDLSFWSPDNLAELTGIEAFRSPEGAIFKTAGKEFFLGSLNRAGARPNQFIEKQIVEMLPKIGRSTAANLSVARAFRNEIDLKKEKIRLTRDLADELEGKLGYVPRNIGQLRDKKLAEYAENKQKELNNDLRAYKSIEEKSKQPFMKVDPGTPISKVVAKAILDQYDKKDPDRAKKAAKQAEELGYTF